MRPFPGAPNSVKPIDQSGQGGQPGPAGLFGSPLLVSETPSFEVLLDEICERLQDTRTGNSLKRIKKMEEILDSLERELDEILEKDGVLPRE
jgi:hypothetical protein